MFCFLIFICWLIEWGSGRVSACVSACVRKCVSAWVSEWAIEGGSGEWVSKWVSERGIDWLIDWLIDRLTDWLTDGLIDRLIHSFIHSFIYWLIDWLTDWLHKWGTTLDCVSCFLLHFFRALPLPVCFTTEQSTVEASLFVNYISNLHTVNRHCSPTRFEAYQPVNKVLLPIIGIPWYKTPLSLK